MHVDSRTCADYKSFVGYRIHLDYKTPMRFRICGKENVWDYGTSVDYRNCINLGTLCGV